MTDSPDWLPYGVDEFIVPRAVFLKMTSQISELQKENKTLKLYYKDWQEQQTVVTGLRAALWDFAKHGSTDFVKEAARCGHVFNMTATDGEGHLLPASFLNALNWYHKTDPRKPS